MRFFLTLTLKRYILSREYIFCAPLISLCNCSHISIYVGVTISLQFIGTGLFIASICTSNAKHNSGHLERKPVYRLIICMNKNLLYHSASFKYFSLHTYRVDMVLGGTTK